MRRYWVVALILALFSVLLYERTGSKTVYVYWAVRTAFLLWIGFGFSHQWLMRFRQTSKPKYGWSLGFLWVFIFLECVAQFYARSESVARPLAGQTWLKLYWKPVNEHGFRDKPIPPAIQGQATIGFLGDSFTAGYGLERIEDRFSSVVEKELSGRYRAINLGVNGSNSDEQVATFVSFPNKKWDVIVWQYFSNDFENYLPSTRVERPWVLTPKFYLLLPVANSFFINHLFFHNIDIRSNMPEILTDVFKNDLESRIRHLRRLRSMANYAYYREFKLIFVYFSFLTSQYNDGLLFHEISKQFQELGVEIIRVEDLIRDLEWSERIVAPHDPHPSREVHLRVGHAIAEKIRLLETPDLSPVLQPKRK